MKHLQNSKKSCIFASENNTHKNKIAKRRAELSKMRDQLKKTMLDKAGVTRSEIHDVAERRWVNANLDLLSASEKKQYAEVLSL